MHETRGVVRRCESGAGGVGVGGEGDDPGESRTHDSFSHHLNLRL